MLRLLFFILEVTDECLRLAAWGRCEFYECLERRFPCGHRGYAVHIGQHFCRKVDTIMDEFTTEVRPLFEIF